MVSYLLIMCCQEEMLEILTARLHSAGDVVSIDNVESDKNIVPNGRVDLHESDAVNAPSRIGNFIGADSFVSGSLIGENQEVITKEELEHIEYVTQMANNDLYTHELAGNENMKFEYKELDLTARFEQVEKKAFVQSKMLQALDISSIIVTERAAMEVDEILSPAPIFPLEQVDSNNLNDKFEITAEELEHIANVARLAEESFPEFQDLTSSPLQRQRRSEDQNETGFGLNIKAEKEQYKCFLGDDQSVTNFVASSAVDVPEAKCMMKEDDKSLMLLHESIIVPLGEMSNMQESQQRKSLNEIQNIQVDQETADNEHIISNSVTGCSSPAIQSLYPEIEIAYIEFEQFHSTPNNTFINGPQMSADENATVESEKLRDAKNRYAELADQETVAPCIIGNRSENFKHSGGTRKSLDLSNSELDSTVLPTTGMLAEVKNGKILTDESIVNGQFALSGGLTEKSPTHFNIPHVTRVDSLASMDHFDEKQNRENRPRHINASVKQEVSNEQIKVNADIRKPGIDSIIEDLKNSSRIVVSAESFRHSRKELAFEEESRVQRVGQREQQWGQLISSKSAVESLKHDFRVGIQRNDQLFEDDTNHFQKIAYKRKEMVGNEKKTMLIMGKSYSRIQPNGKVEFNLEHSNHYLTDGFNVTSTVTYTDRLYKKMTRNLRFSEKMPHYGRANFWKTFNNEKEYCPKRYTEGMKPSFTRASSVFVVYTDQNLLASQFGKVSNNNSVEKTQNHQGNSESVATSEVENSRDIGINLMEQRELTSNITAVVPVLRDRWERCGEISNLSRSLLAHSMFTKTENGEGKESLKRSSAWLLKNEKSRGTHQTNVFERCERESIAGDGSMLHHADCLMRLNFFAERITEQVAELAAVELGNRFRAELNPRARYFLQMRADIDSQTESAPVTPSESDEEIDGKITLGSTEKREPQPITVPETGSAPRSSSWFSLFGGGAGNGEDRPRSPISFLWRTSHRQSDASSRKSSPDGRNEFIDLLRRTSGASSNGSDMGTKLPDSALAGLSSEERDHIEKVLNAANRRSRSSQSTPTASRRQSIYKLPDMNDFELYERTHIEGVIEKAEKGAFPFVIKVTKADTLREDSVDIAEEKTFYTSVKQTTSNTNKPKESVDDKPKVLLDKSRGSTSLSERLEKQQNEKSLGEIAPEASVVKTEQKSSLDAKADLEKSRKSEEVNCEISDVEIEHIRKVTEAARIMEAGNHWLNRSSDGQKIAKNVQNITVANSLIKTKRAEKLNLSESPNNNWRSEPDRRDIQTTMAFPAERMKSEKILSTEEMICGIRKQKVEDSETNEADSVDDTNSLRKAPSLKPIVMKTNSFENDISKAKCITEGMKIVQNYEGLEKKLPEEVVIQINDIEGRMKEPERLENPISREKMETKIVNLTDEELAQIRLVNERVKELEKSNEFTDFAPEERERYKYQEIQDSCMFSEEGLEQRVAGRAKKLQAVDESLLCGSEIDKQENEEKDECLTKYELLQGNTLEERTKELRGMEVTAIVEHPKGISRLPEKRIVEGKATKHLKENDFFEEKEIHDQSKENNTLTEEELMQIRAVEQRAKQMEENFIFERQAAKVFEERKRMDLDLATSRMAAEEKSENDLTEEELKHIKEVERNAIRQFEMPLLQRFSTKDDIIAKVQQKDVALGKVAFNKFASVLNPFKNSVITTLSFKSNVDEVKLSQNIASARDVPKINKEIVEESMKAYPENQDFRIDISTANETNHSYNTDVLVTMMDLDSVQTANEYLENQDSEYISSSESSDFGPGTSDEDEEIDQNNGMFSETVSSTTDFKDDTRESSAKYDIIKNRDLSLEVIPTPIQNDTELLPKNKTEVYSHGIPQSGQILSMTSSLSLMGVTQTSVQLGIKSASDEQTVDRFAGLTEEEIEHIKMVDLQFELENAKDISKVSMHNGEDSEGEDDTNFGNEMTINIEEYEPQEKELAVDVKGPKALSFIAIDHKVRSDTYVDIESIESEKDAARDASQISLKEFATNDKLLEQSVENDLTADQRSKSLQTAYVERDNKVKSLEELGREVNIGKWYEERLSSLRNSLCVEEIPEIPGFDLKLCNLMIIIYERGTFLVH
uniref:BRCT domain-containing protein n=1 Tax=Elaeophora elaphi TaxID=1147741 RepID=A0A0R3S468_9BILA